MRSKKIHLLSNIDGKNSTATCANCGFVKIYFKKSSNGYCCATGAKARKQPSLNPKTVYLIKSDNGLTKIGVANNLTRRFYDLTFSSPCKLTLEHSVLIDKPFLRERQLHDLFADSRSHGEWFFLTNEDIEKAKSLLS